MATQLLVNVITATVPAGETAYAVAHGLKSNDQAVAPTLILPAAQSVVTVASVDDTNVYLANPSAGDVTVTLRCERGLSNEVDAETVTPFFQSVGTGAAPPAPVQSVSVTAPITNTGTASNPIIGASVGSTAGTLCAGDDPRLSNTRTPTALSPNPAGTYGSASAVGVVTVNSAGQITVGASTAIAISASQITSGTLSASRGGTGLSTSSAADSVLTGVSGGGWEARTSWPTDSVLVGAMGRPTALRANGTIPGNPTASLLSIAPPSDPAVTSIFTEWTGGKDVTLRSSQSAGVGGSFYITASSGSVTAGNTIVTAGSRSAGGGGGFAYLTGGAGNGNSGGGAFVQGGNVSTGNFAGGDVGIEGGDGAGTGGGGTVTVSGGEGYVGGGSGIGGAVEITGGGSSTQGGAISVTGGNGSGVGSIGGDVEIKGGPASTTCGNVSIVGGGTSTTISGGDVNITGGQCSSLSPTASAGGVTIVGGSGVSGGSVALSGGTSKVGNVHADVYINGGSNEDVTAEYQGGDIVIKSGNSRNGVSNNNAKVLIIGSTRDYGGDIEIAPGYGTIANGNVSIARAILNNGGTAGQVLLSTGTSSPAVWGTPNYYADPGTASYGAFRYTGVNTTFTATDYLVYTITAAVTVTLPAASTVPDGRIYIVKCGFSGGATLEAAAGEQIDNSSGPWPLVQYEVRRIIRVTGLSVSEWLFI